MGLTEDSRPFTVLRNSAEEFNTLFNEGIELCLSTLNSGISDLLCDPDSLLGSSPNVNRLSAHMEFSKAKYELFVQMQKVFGKFEEDCTKHLESMRETFLENVEIFLAGTKLELQLPTSDTSEKKRSPGSKSLTPSSLYPKLIDSAKKQISRFSSLLPIVDNTQTIDDEDDNQQSSPVRQNGRSPKRVTIVTPQEMEVLSARGVLDDSPVIDISEESDEEPAVVEVAPKRPGRKPAVSTPAQKKIAARTSARKTPEPSTVKDISSDSSGSESKSANTSMRRRNIKTVEKEPNTPMQRRNAKTVEKEVDESTNIDLKDMEDSLPQVEMKGRRATRSQLSTPTVATPSSISGRKTRTPRRKANSSEDSQPAQTGPKTPKSVHFSDDIEFKEDSDTQRSPKSMVFSVGMDITDDLEIYSPDVKISKSTPRRKTTVLSRAMNDFPDMDLTPDSTRGRSKRKTIAGSALDESVAPSPKRLKMGRRSNAMPSSSESEALYKGLMTTRSITRDSEIKVLKIFGLTRKGEDDPMNSNLSASDEASELEHYSPWMPLSDISGSVPPQPGIYELKVAAAKKPAYIGGCDSLRQKLTLHKLKQSSGHKHLDKFIDRNLSNILVRYEQLPSAAVAKSEEKTRVKAFVERFKNSPAYN